MRFWLDGVMYRWRRLWLLSGSLSHENLGNQFGHAASICVNQGLKVYDSTLVVSVFYGVYTATSGNAIRPVSSTP
ncbi:hypothetical protein C8J56DRAFT_924719 [Mycena floridula]|nr:hypothetical protein C8J56DRAFT_924719 [Mycena floridula]